MAKVDIFGTLHVDRPKKVKRELAEFCTDADVLFVESPRDKPDNADEREMFLRNPIFSVTGRLLDFAWGPIGFLLTGEFEPIDGYVTEVVSQEQNIDIEPVDMNLVRRAGEVSIITTVVSWFWLILTVSVFVFGALQLSPNLIIWAAVLGFAPLVPFAYVTLSERDEQIAENIQHTFSTESGVQRGCLVVGRGHMSGVIEELEESDIEVDKTHKSKFCRRNS